jgi:hypothetical protein
MSNNMQETAESGADFLEHFGTKGMKWGVRRAEKKLAKADAKWEKQIYTTAGAIKIHNRVAEKMNGGELDKLNNQPKYKDKNLYDNPALHKQYEKEYSKMAARVYSEAVAEVHGKNPSGTKRAVYTEIGGPRIAITNVTVKHADTEDLEPEIVIPLRLDANRHVVEAQVATMEQTVALGEDFLEHFGVKGMKWGVRKDRSNAPSGPTPVKLYTKPGKGVTAAKGGKGHGVSEDAAAKASTRQKAKASSTDALSNAELKKLVERMNLEQQYKKLASQQSTQSAGAKFVKGLVKNETTALQNGKLGPVTAIVVGGLTTLLAARAGASAGAGAAARNASKAGGKVVVGKVLSSSTKIL